MNNQSTEDNHVGIYRWLSIHKPIRCQRSTHPFQGGDDYKTLLGTIASQLILPHFHAHLWWSMYPIPPFSCVVPHPLAPDRDERVVMVKFCFVDVLSVFLLAVVARIWDSA
jgi:hypothetical protein